VVEKFELHSEQRFSTAQGKSSAQILVATEGAATVHAADHDPVDFAKGDAVVVPACISEFRIQPHREISFLKSYVPGHSVPEPKIRN
jgi:mannose-6-phosphate isomerase class I